MLDLKVQHDISTQMTTWSELLATPRFASFPRSLRPYILELFFIRFDAHNAWRFADAAFRPCPHAFLPAILAPCLGFGAPAATECVIYGAYIYYANLLIPFAKHRGQFESDLISHWTQSFTLCNYSFLNSVELNRALSGGWWQFRQILISSE